MFQLGSEGTALLHHDKPAVPYRFEFGPRHESWSLGARRENDGRIAGDLSEQQEASVTKEWRLPAADQPASRVQADFEQRAARPAFLA